MTKNMKRFLIFGALLAIGTAVFAQTASDFNVELTDDGTGVRIRGYTGTVLAVKIPAMIESMPVREIGSNAFERNRDITSVTFPAGITRIGKHAFSGCFNLTAVTLPAGLLSIEDNAFYMCPKLTRIDIPDSVTTIGAYAFGFYRQSPQKEGLTSVRLPKNLTVLGYNAFASCGALATVTFTGTALTEIPNSAFSRTIILETIVIPDSVTTIGKFAFWGCRNLTSVTLGAGIKLIGEEAFRFCSSLTTVTIPDSVTEIKRVDFDRQRDFDSGFEDCSKLGIAAQAAIKRRGYTGRF
jgi:hypothetical protein